MSYEEFDIERQPPPYRTKCRNYAADKFESSGHCFDHCMERMTARWNWVLPTSYWNQSRGFQVVKTSTLQDNTEIYKTYLKFLGKCKIECKQHSCKHEDFVPYIVSEQESYKLDVIFLAPFSPKKELVHSPKIADVEMFDTVSGALGLWFSFVPLNLIYTDGSRFNLISIVISLVSMAYQYLSNREQPARNNEDDLQMSEIEVRTEIDRATPARLLQARRLLHAVHTIQGRQTARNQPTTSDQQRQEQGEEIQMSAADDLDDLVEKFFGPEHAQSSRSVRARETLERLRDKSKDLVAQVSVLNAINEQQKLKNEEQKTTNDQLEQKMVDMEKDKNQLDLKMFGMEKTMEQMRATMARIAGQRLSHSTQL